MFPYLTFLTLVPLVGGIVLLGLESSRPGLHRRLALGFQALAFLLAAGVVKRFDTHTPEMQFVELGSWIPSIHADYHLGVDGLGLIMVILSALILPFATLVSSPAVSNPRLYYGLLLLLQSGLFGAFTSLNFVHWFLFWELSLIPAYFLIKLWGGPRRGEAARMFFVYTMVGSVALLLSFLGTYVATGTFDFAQLADKGRGLDGGLAAIYNIKLQWYSLSTRGLALVLFGGVFLGFAVKVPIWPFQTWLPLAYSEAPTPVTMVLTGVMSKLGLYGVLRILLPIFPEQLRWMQTPLLWLAVASVVLGALAALAQWDIKRMLAYLSVSHLGYCWLGILAAVQVTPGDARWGVEKSAALSGVLVQMLNHGIIAATLFGMVGWLEQRTGGRRGVEDFGGLRKVAPVFCGLMGIALFASIGLPGLSGFVGEFLIFKGASALSTWAAALSSAGLLVTAVFLLTLAQKVWHGPLAESRAGFPDLTLWERAVAAPAVGLMFLLGICPQLVMKLINPAVSGLVERLNL
ncbi:MAG TPA: NADH-quinone oxidoreductase subunit M [Verrucomicrobiales bacterium]|nr:NADH-quinone oxidoreductase subunit M [Verrucomicrobiales bacterium]